MRLYYSCLEPCTDYFKIIELLFDALDCVAGGVSVHVDYNAGRESEEHLIAMTMTSRDCRHRFSIFSLFVAPFPITRLYGWGVVWYFGRSILISFIHHHL